MRQSKRNMLVCQAIAALTAYAVLLQPQAVIVHAAHYAPNHFLGQCFDQEWVNTTAQTLGLNVDELDSRQRRIHPYLHAALKRTRFKITDRRTEGVPMSQLYNPNTCGPTTGKIYGVGSTVDPSSGATLDPGTVEGSLIFEMNDWVTHELSTTVLAIIARELLGFPVSIYAATENALTAQRMSSVYAGLCMPVHIDCEDWSADQWGYRNETYTAGSSGYMGRSGIYTTKDFVTNGSNTSPPFDADFWRDYTWNEQLLANLPLSALVDNNKYFPPDEVLCPDDTMGCKDGCSKTSTCVQREAVGKDCMVVLLMYPSYDPGYAEAVFANIGIPAYFCFIGQSGIENYVVEAQKSGTPVVFYHFEPDPFHFAHVGKFERIFLPLWDPTISQLGTKSFGENGYGGKTTNPVDVDFAITDLTKFAATILKEYEPLANFYSSFSLTNLNMHKLLELYASMSSPGGLIPVVDDAPVFSAACSWLRDNYLTWKQWMTPLPTCEILTDMTFVVKNCGSDAREIHFEWLFPDPDDISKPYTCDGGSWGTLPAVIYTSRSCEWITDNTETWYSWIVKTPTCDSSFYTHSSSECDENSKRMVTYAWLLPDPANSSLSRECKGFHLPRAVEIECEFVPYSAVAFTAVAVVAVVLMVLLAVMAGFIWWFRREPIIKRSQWEFLSIMIVGGMLICVSTIVYAGEPTSFLCGARPVVLSTGFTLTFGSLLVKSLRVYRVFLSGAMKRVVLSSAKMLKMVGLFLVVDILILSAWFIADYPHPSYELHAQMSLNGESVAYNQCRSSSFIFTAVLIFWKAIVLFTGLYLSLLIRKVSTDFQESVWIFASSLVVLVASVIMLPLTYLVDLPASIFYMLMSFVLLCSTGIVMAMMLLPKALRLHEQASDSTVGDTRSKTSPTEENTANANTVKDSRSRPGTSTSATVTPIIPFASKGGPLRGPSAKF